MYGAFQLTAIGQEMRTLCGYVHISDDYLSRFIVYAASYSEGGGDGEFGCVGRLRAGFSEPERVRALGQGMASQVAAILLLNTLLAKRLERCADAPIRYARRDTRWRVAGQFGVACDGDAIERERIVRAVC